MSDGKFSNPQDSVDLGREPRKIFESKVVFSENWLGKMYLLAQHGGESAAILAPTVQSILCTTLQQLPAYV